MIVIFSSRTVMATDLQELKSKKIADFFIYTAQNIITELSKTTNRINYTDESLSLEDLSEVLKSSSIEVQYTDLIDNSGSLVDALGTNHKVILSGYSWSEFMRAKKDIRLLVLHELLRMAQINDDNYKYSLNILPPLASQNKIAPYCNLRIQTTKVVYSSKDFKGTGYTTPVSSGYFTGQSPNAQEAQDNAVKDMKEKCDKKGYNIGPQNIRGRMAMSSKNNNGFISNTIEAQLTGICYKPENVARDKKEQKAEICNKVELCRNILQDSQTTESEDFENITKLTSKWNCQ